MNLKLISLSVLFFHFSSFSVSIQRFTEPRDTTDYPMDTAKEVRANQNADTDDCKQAEYEWKEAKRIADNSRPWGGMSYSRYIALTNMEKAYSEADKAKVKMQEVCEKKHNLVGNWEYSHSICEDTEDKVDERLIQFRKQSKAIRSFHEDGTLQEIVKAPGTKYCLLTMTYSYEIKDNQIQRKITDDFTVLVDCEEREPEDTLEVSTKKYIDSEIAKSYSSFFKDSLKKVAKKSNFRYRKDQRFQIQDNKLFIYLPSQKDECAQKYTIHVFDRMN